MSFLKLSNLEAKLERLYTSNLVIKEIKHPTIISDKQNFKNKVFRWVLYIQNQFYTNYAESFQILNTV